MNDTLTPGWYFSENESQILGIKVARFDYVEKLDPTFLSDIILKNEPDLIRIKLDARDRTSFSLLESLNIPYFILNISNVYRIDLDQMEYPVYSPGLLKYEKYSSSQNQQLEYLIREIYAGVPGTYYLNPGMLNLISNGEIDAMVQYTLTFDEDLDKNKTTYFVKIENETIGFFSIRLYNDHAEGNLFGILPQFRGRDYANDIIRFIMQFLHEKQKKYFDVNIQLHNLPSLNTHISLGYKPVKALLNIHINSLLSKTQVNSEIRLYQYLSASALIESAKTYIEGINKSKYQLTGYKHSCALALVVGKEYRQIINVPVNSFAEILVVVKLYDAANLSSFAYLWFKPL